MVLNEIIKKNRAFRILTVEKKRKLNQKTLKYFKKLFNYKNLFILNTKTSIKNSKKKRSI